MARGPSYRVHFRRRREGKTNYYLRRSLLVSGKRRVVIRPTVKNITCQVSDAHLKGDIILAAAHSKELSRDFNWNYNTGNLPTAYITGYLLGKKALKAGVTDAILDIGLRVHINRTYAALKGVIDAGIDVPHSNKIFPSDERLSGVHIENYAKLLNEREKTKDEGEESETKPSSQFIAMKKAGVDIMKMSTTVKDVKAKIDKKYA
ncbi:MAG: 50S ribosomal protein L18 [Promethearchaeota archaeon]